jgi:DNA mismatch repair protein MutS2
MDEKTLVTLEYGKILERLAEYCAFPASAELARSIRPSNDIFEARRLLDETNEAVQLLVVRPGLSIGGARDVRPSVDLAEHAAVLDPGQLLDIKYTLIAARTLKRTLEKFQDQYPHIVDLALQLPEPLGLIDTISRAISDRGEILDSASAKLSTIRHDLRIAHDRLLNKLQRMVNDPKIAQYLQDALVTQRDGRYVLPLRAEFKGRLKSIVHDQSASGATIFVEPLSVVELNNKFRELQLAERDEERRILAELSQLVAGHAYEINHTVETLAVIDLTLARAKMANQMAAAQPVLHPIQPKGTQHPGTIIRLYEARHPLLEPETVVPIDVELDPRTYAMIITGPNTGGKTVTLKTVGLLSLMAQSGMHIPAASGSEISLFNDVYADIGDEQSIEQSLSTFSGHITNIIRILEFAGSKSLVIMDELGAGTDPQEGAVLARALLDHLLERHITTLVTTHHPELKAYAHDTPGVVNASVEFDLDTLQPTFHLTIGLPGRSNALAIAQRLGLPEPIVSSARSELRPEDIQAEDLLDEIHRQRDLSRQARAAAEKARREAEDLRSDLASRLDNIEDERMCVLESARIENEDRLQELEAEISKVRRELMRAKQPLEVVKEIEEQIDEIKEEVVQPVERQLPEVSIPQLRAIRLGDKVRLRTLGTKGVVTALSGEEAEVQVGVMRVRTRLTDIELPLVGNGPQEESVKSPATTGQQPIERSVPSTSKLSKGLPPSPGFELDLRGQRADDALESLDKYLEKAYLSALPFVRIIHGKGTGRLRTVVRETLGRHPYVNSFESGKEKEGGDGVTVAKLDVD